MLPLAACSFVQDGAPGSAVVVKQLSAGLSPLSGGRPPSLQPQSPVPWRGGRACATVGLACPDDRPVATYTRRHGPGRGRRSPQTPGPSGVAERWTVSPELPSPAPRPRATWGYRRGSKARRVRAQAPGFQTPKRT